jgi:hypothetical protein
MPPLYEVRLVAYLDILGWSEACKVESDRLATAAKLIHDAANDYSSATKDRIESLARETEGTEANPMYLSVQAGAFSDNYVLSMPVCFGLRILSSASALCIKLLQLGFLTRGGVTIGPVYHHDNVVFGPALIEAVALENEAHYPRLLCSDNLLAHLATLKTNSANYVLDDQLGRKIVNPFVPVAKIAGRSVRDFHNEVWDIPGIERTVEAELCVAQCGDLRWSLRKPRRLAGYFGRNSASIPPWSQFLPRSFEYRDFQSPAWRGRRSLGSRHRDQR